MDLTASSRTHNRYLGFLLAVVNKLEKYVSLDEKVPIILFLLLNEAIEWTFIRTVLLTYS